MTSITDFTEINRGIQEQESLLATLDLTSKKLETIIADPTYGIKEAIRIEGKGNLKIVDAVERVTGFGQEMASMFETLASQLGRIPTETEFNAACTKLVKAFWLKEKPDGIVWGETVEATVINRNIRCYMAQINELHCLLLLRELFPEWKIVSSDDLDLLMGVDIIVETKNKRLYLHLFKNSKFSFLAFRKKEKRGGRKDGDGKFQRYQRDFSGDKTLMYEGRADSSSETTKFINGIPLFKAEWLESQLLLFDNFRQFGEPLHEVSKLVYLEEFLVALHEKQEVAA